MAATQGPLRLVPLGVGEAFSARHYTCCVGLEYEGEWLLLDCPHPIRKMMREGSLSSGLPLDIDRVRGIALSHLHADHCSGLEDFAFYNHFVLNRRSALIAHPDVLADLWPCALSAGMSTMRQSGGRPPMQYTFDSFFEAIPLNEGQTVTLGPFAIECRFTLHAIPTTAFRVTAGGRSVSYSADTAFDPDLVAWLAEADLAIHEVTDREEAGLHTPYRELAALTTGLREKLRLIHYSDDFQETARTIPILEQGELIFV